MPLSLQYKVFFTGSFTQAGWLFLAMGTLVFWTFGIDATIASLFSFTGKLAQTTGIVTGSQDTSNKNGRKSSYSVDYQFDANGRTFTGLSYGPDQKDSGETVTIEYRPNQPTISRIKGMRSSPIETGALIVLIFPAIGLAVIIPSLKRGAKLLRLLQTGTVTGGKLVAKKEVLIPQTNQRTFELTFEFTASDGETYRTYIDTLHTNKLEDEELEQLVYNPANPYEVMVLGEFPGDPYLDEEGNMMDSQPNLAPIYLVIPAVVAMINIAAIYFKYMA